MSNETDARDFVRMMVKIGILRESASAMYLSPSPLGAGGCPGFGTLQREKRLIRIRHEQDVFCQALSEVLDATFSASCISWEPSDYNLLVVITIVATALCVVGMCSVRPQSASDMASCADEIPHA